MEEVDLFIYISGVLSGPVASNLDTFFILNFMVKVVSVDLGFHQPMLVDEN